MQEKLIQAKFNMWACTNEAKSARQFIINCQSSFQNDEKFMEGLLYALQYATWKAALESIKNE